MGCNRKVGGSNLGSVGNWGWVVGPDSNVQFMKDSQCIAYCPWKQDQPDENAAYMVFGNSLKKRKFTSRYGML